MSWFSRTLAALAPGVALARAEKRARLEHLNSITNLYQAASYDRSFAGWITHGTDANAEIRGQVELIRNRARDLGRNNPYIARAYSILSAKLVGKGVRPRLMRVPAQVRERTLSDWSEWVETCDPDGQQDLYGLQLLAVRTMIESGEALIQFIPVTPSPTQRIPWQIRVLEPDMIDMSQNDDLPGGNRVVDGVEFSRDGKRVAYYLFREHPGSNHLSSLVGYREGVVRVPAEYIAPLYRQDRPDQIHGVPWVAPVAPFVQHLDDIYTANLIREKIQTCFAAFIRTPNRLTARGEAGLTSRPGAITRSEQISPGMIDYLNDSEEITFSNPPSATENGEHHVRVLQAIASGLGVTYAQLTGDLSQTNYSSARTGGLDQWALLDQWQHLLIKPMLLAPIWQKFEQITSTRQGRRGMLKAEWDFPARELLDPEKDGAARDEALASGRITFSQAIQEGGRDPEAHLDELLRERKRFEAEGLTFPWLMAQTPAPSPTPEEEQTPPPEDEEEDQ